MISKRNDSVAIEFDQTGIFRAEIQDKIDDLKRTCKRYSIPMFVSCLVSNGHNETGYINEMLTPSFLNRNGIYDDKIAEYVKVVLGYRTVKDSSRKVVNEDGQTVMENDFDAIMELTNSIHDGQFVDEEADLVEAASVDGTANEQKITAFDIDDICLDQIEGEVSAYK